MNNNLREIKLGAPPSIVLSKGCPNAELSAQVMQNCEELVLKDDGVKCTTQGAIKTAAALLGQRVNEDVTEQDWYTPADEEKPIKVDIQGGGEVTGKEINALYNALDLYTDDSNIVGNVTCQGCYEQDKIALESRFENFHIETTVFFVRFEDPEVERVLMAKGVGNEFGITTEQLKAVTNISDWFNNSNIKTFDEFEYTGVKSFERNQGFMNCVNLESIKLPDTLTKTYGINGSDAAFYNCKSLKRLDTNNITNLCAGFANNSGLEVIFCKRVKQVGNYLCLGSNTLKASFFPSLNNNSGYCTVGKKITDFGIKDYKTPHCSVLNTAYRSQSLPTFVDGSRDLERNTNAKLFTVPSMVDSVKESLAYVENKIFPIGGPEWATAMQSLAAEENYTLKPGQSFSDAYIDYDIYGIPEEDRPFVSFKDAEVEAVLAKNGVGGDGLITKEAFESITSVVVNQINTSWFTNNPNIETFDEFENMKLTNVPNSSLFAGCTKLRSIKLPSNIWDINEYNTSMFENCSSLKHFDFSQLKCIAYRMFFNSAIEGVVDLSNVERITGNNCALCFVGCSNITQFILSPVIKELGVGFNNKTEPPMLMNTDYLESTEGIPVALFRSVPSVNFSSMKIIGNCYDSRYRDYTCKSIGDLDNIEEFKAHGFYLWNMPYVRITNTRLVPKISSTFAFSGTNASANCLIYVPDSLYDQYLASSEWKRFVDAGKIKKLSQWDTDFPNG